MNRPVEGQPWGKRKASWYSGVLLDVGAGCGALCIPFARAFDRVTALDASDPMLDELRKRTASPPMRLSIA